MEDGRRGSSDECVRGRTKNWEEADPLNTNNGKYYPLSGGRYRTVRGTPVRWAIIHLSPRKSKSWIAG